MMRTSNPTLRADTFSSTATDTISGEVMTIQGTVNKTLVLLLLTFFTASWAWKQALQATGFMPLGLFGGLICALILIFKKEWAPVLAPIYALFEGLFLGGFSMIFERAYPGIVIQAVSLTFGTLFVLLMAYKTRLIQPTEKFKLGIVAATGGIMIVYLVSIVIGFFGGHMPMIFGSGPVGIGFSIVVVIIAALNLVLDFDFIEQGAQQGAPRYMEWYAGFGLLVTLIWLYLEILRLLAKLQDRR